MGGELEGFLREKSYENSGVISKEVYEIERNVC